MFFRISHASKRVCDFALQLQDLRLIREELGRRGGLLRRWREAGRDGALGPGRAGCREWRAKAGAFLIGPGTLLEGGDDRRGFGGCDVGRRAPSLAPPAPSLACSSAVLAFCRSVRSVPSSPKPSVEAYAASPARLRPRPRCPRRGNGCCRRPRRRGRRRRRRPGRTAGRCAPRRSCGGPSHGRGWGRARGAA